MRQVSGKLAVASFASALLLFGCAGKSESNGNGDGGDDDGASVIGGSGVTRGKNLEDLTDDEKRRLCAWAVPQEGGPGDKDCGDGNTLSTPTVEECAQAEFGFPCSVGLIEDCIRTLDGDACNLFVTAECLAYLECALGSGQ